MSSNKDYFNSEKLIRRFTISRIKWGALIFALFVCIESLAQSLGIIAAYPNAAKRAKVVDSLANSSALNLFYGSKSADIVSAGGYMVYRILPSIALIGAVWAAMFITKMLRGQEENGRWEILISGQTSAKKATLKTIIGAITGIIAAYLVVALIMIGAGKNNKLNFSAGSALYYSLAAVAGAFIGLSIGAISSQLGATRRISLVYSIAFIAIFAALRSIGNTVTSLSWLKCISPFGWVDKLSPFYHPSPIWLVPIAGLTIIGCWAAIYLSGVRDMDESLIADKDTAKPKLKLLNSQLGFDFRATKNLLAGYLFMCLVFAAVVAAIDKAVAKSLTSTGKLSKTFSNLSGNHSAGIELAYLGAAAYLTVTILMLLVTSGISAARNEEESSRLDNFLSGRVSRSKWLTNRVVLLTLAAVTMTFLSNLLVYLIAEAQGVKVSASSMLFGGLSILGPIFFLLGAGILCLGIKPRVATIIMYAIIVWSFSIDIISSTVKTSKFLADTSLLHHISLVPAASPQWKAFIIMSLIGIIFAYSGILMFNRRDLEAE